MDFHRAFEEIDEDSSGSISVEELEHYCNKMNYKEGFVNKWLQLFDLNHDGEITYDEFCEVLGLVPRKNVIDRARRVSLQMQTNATLLAAAQSGSPKKSKKETSPAADRKITDDIEPLTSSKEVSQALSSRRRQSNILTNAVKLAAASVEPTAKEETQVDNAVRRKSMPEAMLKLHGTACKCQLFMERYVKCKNREISHGITRFSKNKMIEKKALYRYSKTAGVDKKLKRLQKAVAAAVTSNEKKADQFKTKPIGGDNNGGTREVALTKEPRNIPTQTLPKKVKLRRNPVFSEHKRRLKGGIVPGTILILLSGLHRGKRVVFLKQLKSGLLLVTGPYKLNGCPLRRVNQVFTIATSTRIDLSGVDIPKRLTDVYFKRAPKKDRKKKPTEIFSEDKPAYTASDERRQDQKLVDSQIIDQIKKNTDKKLMFQYLASLFSLSRKDYPHKMKF